MARSRLRGVRLPPELDAEFTRFCELTNRDPNDVIRRVLRLFLADGPQQAELRLTRQLWQGDAQAEAEGELDVVALKETRPPNGGRQLVIYTPQGFKGDLKAIENAVKTVIQAERAKGQSAKRRPTGTQGRSGQR